MTGLTILHLLCSTLRVTRAVQKSWLWQRGSSYIFLSVQLPLCIPLHARMKSVFIPPRESIATRYKPSSTLGGGGVGTGVHSWTFSPASHLTHMRAHIRANLLILPPVLLSISGGSGVVGVDGCWQALDCWGKDDGSSCRDRIAVSRDPLQGFIRLLWNLLPIRPSLKQKGRMQPDAVYSVQMLSLSLPPIAPTYLPLFSHTCGHTFLFTICACVSQSIRPAVARSAFSNEGEFRHHIRTGAYLLCFMFHEHIMHVQYISRCTACTESWHWNLRSTCSWHDTWKTHWSFRNISVRELR